MSALVCVGVGVWVSACVCVCVCVCECVCVCVCVCVCNLCTCIKNCVVTLSMYTVHSVSFSVCVQCECRNRVHVLFICCVTICARGCGHACKHL